MFMAILCPVDFSAVSARALSKAIALAAESHASLTLLHVTDSLLDAAARAAGTEDTITEQTQEELRALLKQVSPDGVKGPMTMAVAVGDPAQEILRQAFECNADLIVMGTQGRGAAQRLLMGSTTSRVVEATTIPVLVVPPLHR
jgi:nucleotide-binding universal stress UspA family protein